MSLYPQACLQQKRLLRAVSSRHKGWSTEHPLIHRVPLLTVTLQTTPSSQLYSQPDVFRAATTIDNELWFCFRQWSQLLQRYAYRKVVSQNKSKLINNRFSGCINIKISLVFKYNVSYICQFIQSRTQSNPCIWSNIVKSKATRDKQKFKWVAFSILLCLLQTTPVTIKFTIAFFQYRFQLLQQSYLKAIFYILDTVFNWLKKHYHTREETFFFTNFLLIYNLSYNVINLKAALLISCKK